MKNVIKFQKKINENIEKIVINQKKIFIQLSKLFYQTYKTEVVHQDSLKLTDSKIAEITLVTCVPKYKYDHRLLVTASLIGIRPL